MINQSLEQLKAVLSNLENVTLDKPVDKLSIHFAIAHIKDAIKDLESID